MAIDLNDTQLISPWAGGIDLNNVESHIFDYDDFWARVSQYAAHWVPVLYPQGKYSQDRRTYHLADATGRAPRKNGSFVIQLTGSSAGTGYEYDPRNNKRYTATDMVEAKEGLKGHAAIDFLAKILGIDTPWDSDNRAATKATPPILAPLAPPPAPHDPDRYKGDIQLLLSKCQPAKGTETEKYWERRNIPMPDCADLMHCSDAADLAEKVGKPAMVLIVRYPDGRQAPGVHRTFLNADGTKTKKMIGGTKGGVVMLAPMGADGRLGIGEGAESSAAAMWLYGVPTWAALSAGNMAALDLSKIKGLKKLGIFIDKGAAGQDAGEKLLAQAAMLGIEAEIFSPISDDDFAKDVENGRKPEARTEEPRVVQGEVLESFDALVSAAREIRMDTLRDARLSFFRRIAVARLTASDEGIIQRILKSGANITAAEFRQDLARFRRELASAPANLDNVPAVAREMAERYVLVKELGCFYDLVTHKFLKKQSIIDAHKREMPMDDYGQPTDPDVFLTGTPGLGTVVDGITFMPRAPMLIQRGGALMLNTWEKPTVVAAPGDVTPWLNHINYLMDGNEVAFKHMCWYLAHVIAMPEIKIAHAPVVVSQQEGIGKTTIGRMLRHIVGKKNCTLIENSDLTSDFNEWVDGKQLIIVNEMRSEGDVKVRNRLAQYITDDTLRVNRKGMPTYDYENRMNFLFFSNYKDAVQLRKNDRRFFVWISGAQPKPESYYEQFNHWFFDCGGAEAVLAWAQSYDLNQHRPHVRPPMTEAKEEMIEASRSNIDAVLSDLFGQNKPPFTCDLVVLTDAAQYLERERRIKVTNKKLGEFLEEMGGVKLGKRPVDGGYAVVWAIRSINGWKVADDKMIEKAYYRAGDPPAGGYGGVLG